MEKPHPDSTVKVLAVIQGLAGKPVTEICGEHGISLAEYDRWREQFLSDFTKPLQATVADRSKRGSNLASLFAVLGKSWEALPEPLRVAQELFEVLPTPVFFKGRDGKYLGVNKAWEDFFGVPREIFLGKEVHHLYPQSPQVADKHYEMDQELWRHPGSQSYEIPVTTRDGRVRHTIYYKATFTRADGEVAGLIGTIVDITERKQLERQFQDTFEQAAVGIVHTSADGCYLQVNQKFCEMLGYSASELLGRAAADFTHPEDREKGRQYRQPMWEGKLDKLREEKRYLRKDGSVIWTNRTVSLARDISGKPMYFIRVIEDITEHKLGEQRQAIEYAVTRLLAEAHSIVEAMPRVVQTLCESLGYAYGARWVHDPREHVLRNTESWCLHDPAVEAFRQVSTTRVETLTASPGGLNRGVWATGEPVWLADVALETTLKRRESALKAGLRSAFAFPLRVGGEFYGVMEFFSREVKPRDERVLDIAQTAGSQIGQFIARKQAEAALRAAHDELARKAQELTRSNAELEQFAYVASHDLQEPLRMISSYTQLLLRRYGNSFDSEAKEFMDFVVDGATRMKQLIEDLLAYSRVGTHGKEFRPTECEAVLKKALVNLRAAIEASGAAVTHDPLPTVDADEVQLAQLFQNLIGNALKFKGAETPRIHVGVTQQADGWEFAVRDNGIGIDPQYFERIFMVFQRLHGKGEYPGTGIGLAICKKVVDRHGGRIRVESQPGHGATFYFTLPNKGGHANG
jgi:PAS domain S-box-containing protein